MHYLLIYDVAPDYVERRGRFPGGTPGPRVGRA